MRGLLRLAKPEGIHVAYCSLPPGDCTLGMNLRDSQGDPFILLDQHLLARPRLKRCVLAEVVGHHPTIPSTSFYATHFSYFHTTAIRRDEARAFRWVAIFAIPFDQPAGQWPSVHADHIHLSKWMLWSKLQFLKPVDLREQGCLRVRRRDMLSPLLLKTGKAFVGVSMRQEFYLNGGSTDAAVRVQDGSNPAKHFYPITRERQ